MGAKRTVELLEQLIESKEHLADMLTSKGEEASFDEPFNDLVEKAGEYIPKSFIFVDEGGNEIPGFLVDQETIFTATANDIREGKVAASELGVVVGEKEIPSYYTVEGISVVQPGKELKVTIAKGDMYDYTKLQALVCKYNTSMANSVAAEKVVINDKVYESGSTVELSSITKDANSKSVLFGIINTNAKLALIRYFTYKEIE